MSEKPGKNRVSVTITKAHADILNYLVEEGIYLVEEGIYLTQGEIVREALRNLFRKRGYAVQEAA